ncbi:hypothetical protein FQN60_018558, partial [Etheostoma spectabile]
MFLLSRSQRTQEYITQIFSHCCKTPEHQTVLFNHSAIQNIAPLLISPSYKVFVRMMQRDQPIEMQLTAAKCLTYMCRAGAIRTDDSCIVLKERVEGAETLAYLMEPDVELQRIASTTDHLVAMLADYFKYPSS